MKIKTKKILIHDSNIYNNVEIIACIIGCDSINSFRKGDISGAYTHILIRLDSCTYEKVTSYFIMGRFRHLKVEAEFIPLYD